MNIVSSACPLNCVNGPNSFTKMVVTWLPRKEESCLKRNFITQRGLDPKRRYLLQKNKTFIIF